MSITSPHFRRLPHVALPCILGALATLLTCGCHSSQQQASSQSGPDPYTLSSSDSGGVPIEVRTGLLSDGQFMQTDSFDGGQSITVELDAGAANPFKVDGVLLFFYWNPGFLGNDIVLSHTLKSEDFPGGGTESVTARITIGKVRHFKSGVRYLRIFIIAPPASSSDNTQIEGVTTMIKLLPSWP